MKWTEEEQRQHRAEWCAALESGAYQQSYHQLHDGDGFCCLGVACDVYFQETGDGTWAEDGYLAHIRSSDERMETYLPEVVRRYFGLQSETGEFSSVREDVPSFNDDLEKLSCTHSLAALNDELKVSFDTIAEIIRAEPPLLLDQENACKS